MGRPARSRTTLGLVGVGLAACVGAVLEKTPTVDGVPIPKLWDERALADWATPIAGLGRPPGHFSEAEYYAAPVDNVRTWPVYHPDREPPGYRDRLRAQGARPLIEPEKLATKDDWIAAGRRVFEELDTAALRSSDPAVLDYFGDGRAIDAHRDATHDVMTRDGVLLDYRWVVKDDGTLQIGMSSCAGCHTRLLPDGSLLAGAPCNFDVADSPASRVLLAKLQSDPPPAKGQALWQSFGVPWLADDVHRRFRDRSDEEVDRFFEAGNGAPPGTTFDRFNGSPFFTTRMADLNGISHRRWLDTTGSHRHRGPADLARYGILVEFADDGEFGGVRMLPEVNQRLRCRPPDAAMYALGLYLETLEAPASPHPFDASARRGADVFTAEGCAECHPPPLYTSNELIPVDEIGTDPGLATRTRKGTGSYRVPTLRGLWYRGLYEHSGSIASLEEWFGRERLSPDYVPSGWRGYGVRTRAVPGHEFGLDLDAGEKRDLVAFLRTL